MKIKIIFLAPLLLLLSCTIKTTEASAQSLNSEKLVIEKIAGHTYRHISYLNTNGFGKVACNGMVVTQGNEAIIFDTPTDVETSYRLIDWVENKLGCKVKAVIATHFHDDCLAGLPAFHERRIPSYANEMTIQLAQKKGAPIPHNGFKQAMELPVGREKVLLTYFGEGHTKDNIIGYYPADEVMFGGCLIKELGAGKGNLEDANTNDWSQTVKKVKENYPTARIVVPGHGDPGDSTLLNYTIQLFEKK